MIALSWLNIRLKYWVRQLYYCRYVARDRIAVGIEAEECYLIVSAEQDAAAVESASVFHV
jgi:hypothetical protein